MHAMTIANWFIGWPADHWTPADAVTRMQAALPLPPASRPMTGDDLHVTLAFLGACGEQAAQQAFDCALVQARTMPTTIDLQARAWALLGSSQSPSAVALEMADSGGEIQRLIADHRPQLYDAAQARPDRRPPRPHVTVARLDRRLPTSPRHQLAHALGQRPPPEARLSLNALALFTWTEQRDERLFRRVRFCPLGKH